MMQTRYCACPKCGEVFEYHQDGNWTDFPRGEFLVHQDYFTTGLKTPDEAMQWLIWGMTGEGSPTPGRGEWINVTIEDLIRYGAELPKGLEAGAQAQAEIEAGS